MAAEQKRLAREQSVLDLIKHTANYCKESLKTLDATRVGKSNSSSYEQLHKMLERGSTLGPHTNLHQMSEFLRQITQLSDSYSSSHAGVFGPATADGKTRLLESRAIGTFGVNASEKLKKLSASLGDKNTPIGLRILHRSDDLEYLEKRQQELRGPEKQSAAAPEQQPAAQPEQQPAGHALSM